MIVEERNYVLYPGAVPDYLALYEQEGLAIQEPILGYLIGYFFTEIGAQNEVVHLWGYENFDERMRRRSELGANEEWQSYVRKIRPLVRHQTNRVLRPAPFSPIR